MNIHHNLELIKSVAIQKAKDHKCNYNVVLMNANAKGEFDSDYGSTYEFVLDSGLQKDADNVKLLFRTEDLISEKKEIGQVHKMGIVGMGNLGRVVASTNDSSPVILVDSKVSTPETTIPSMFDEPFSEMIIMDHDVFPKKKFKGGTNLTPPKKKRK